MEKLIKEAQRIGNLAIEMAEIFREATIKDELIPIEKLDTLIKEMEGCVIKLKKESLKFDGDPTIERLINTLEKQVATERERHDLLKNLQFMLINI